MKPICFPCQRFFKPIKNDFGFLEGIPEIGAKAGTAEPEKWRPYKLWSGDKWKCLGCGAEIIVGFGLEPISVHHEKDFEEKVKSFGVTYQVNDC